MDSKRIIQAGVETGSVLSGEVGFHTGERGSHERCGSGKGGGGETLGVGSGTGAGPGTGVGVEQDPQDVRTTRKPKGKTREAILGAAGRLFADRGFQVSTRAIADASGTNIGSISYYFGNKKGLIDAVLDHATQGWKNHADVVEYIIDSSADLFKTPEGRLQILTNVYSFLFKFYIYDAFGDRLVSPGGENSIWRFALLSKVLSTQDEDNDYKRKLTERVMDPNRISFQRLILALCPNLAPEEIFFFSVHFFVAPLLHYSIMDFTKPIPQVENLTSGPLIEKIKRSLAYSIWLVIEDRRKGGGWPLSLADHSGQGE